MSEEKKEYTQGDVERAFNWYMKGFNRGRGIDKDCCCDEPEEKSNPIADIQSVAIATLNEKLNELHQLISATNCDLEDIESRVSECEKNSVDEGDVRDMATEATEDHIEKILDYRIEDHIEEILDYRIEVHVDDAIDDIRADLGNQENLLKNHRHFASPSSLIDGQTSKPVWEEND